MIWFSCSAGKIKRTHRFCVSITNVPFLFSQKRTVQVNKKQNKKIRTYDDLYAVRYFEISKVKAGEVTSNFLFLTLRCKIRTKIQENGKSPIRC